MNDYPFKGRDPLYEGTHHGIRWCIYQAPLNSVLNGYACIPEGTTIDVDTLEVHGGITYGSGQCGAGWIGFDTAHGGDLWNLKELREKVGVHITPAGEAWQRNNLKFAPASFDRMWTVDALRAECERLCEQIAAKSAAGSNQ